MKNIALFVFITLAFASCNSNGEKADAYGNFEATEVIVSAEANGKLLQFQVENGQKLEKNQQVGLVDTTQLHLKKVQLAAQISAVRSKASSVLTQLDVLQAQEKSLLREKQRIAKLLQDEAATQKQMDDIETQLEVVGRQMKGIRVQNQSVLSEIEVMDAQLLQIDDQILKCKILNPISGVVLKKFSEESELVLAGKALYKIADLSQLELKAYVEGSQLSQIKIGQAVEVWFDADKETLDKLPGKITWIASSAEFTPKIIQTKSERINMVYAIKVLVENDGRLKIGMPAEVKW